MTTAAQEEPNAITHNAEAVGMTDGQRTWCRGCLAINYNSGLRVVTRLQARVQNLTCVECGGTVAGERLWLPVAQSRSFAGYQQVWCLQPWWEEPRWYLVQWSGVSPWQLYCCRKRDAEEERSRELVASAVDAVTRPEDAVSWADAQVPDPLTERLTLVPESGGVAQTALAKAVARHVAAEGPESALQAVRNGLAAAWLNSTTQVPADEEERRGRAASAACSALDLYLGRRR